VRSTFAEKVLEKNISDDTDKARKKDENCSLFVGELFFYDSSEVEDNEENRVNDEKNIGSDRGKGGNSWVVLSEFHGFQEEVVSSLGFYETELHCVEIVSKID
jgi:hypothetical protein